MPALPKVRLAGSGPKVLDAAVVQRQARTALTVNLVLGICAFGLPSIPGAVLAWRSLRALPEDVPRAGRLLQWSWGLLAATLVFYVLLLVLVGDNARILVAHLLLPGDLADYLAAQLPRRDRCAFTSTFIHGDTEFGQDLTSLLDHALDEVPIPG